MKLIRKYNPDRIWEIDLVRGIALLLMIYFHVIFDLADIFGIKISYTGGINYIIGKISVLLFIFVSGVSSMLSRNNLKRGIQILMVALALTVVTHLADKSLGVKFGILHFLGICMILYPFFKKIKSRYLIFAGTIIIIAGLTFEKMVVNFDYLFMFNITSNSFYSADYYPLFPWMGIYLFGITAGRYLYADRKSRFDYVIQDNIMLMAGRNTLLVYLIHQPIILLILNIIFKLF